MNNFCLRELTFSDILPVWRNYLWPNRKSPIESISQIQIFGEIDSSISAFSPYFFGLYLDDDTLVGVNSCHMTSNSMVRSRGIYIFESYRGKGLTKALFAPVENFAHDNKCNLVWSMPRLSALPAYLSFGFTAVSSEENKYNEQGENHIYVSKRI